MAVGFKREISSHVEEYVDEAVELAKELIEIPTVNPPGENYEECARLLTAKAREYGLEATTVRVPMEQLPKLTPWGVDLPRVNVLARWGMAEGPVFNIHAHYDVVPAGEGWTTEPFRGVVREGRLYGRGASDMKGGLAASLVVAKALKDLKIRPWGSLVYSFSPDEETGGKAGAGFLLSGGYLKADMSVIPEPSGVDNVWNSHKGALWLEVILHGKAAHASLPHLGVNAFEAMLHVASAVNKMKEELPTRISEYHSLRGPERPSINVGGMCSSGPAVNVIPEKASFTVDRRLIPEENMDDVEGELKTVIEDAARSAGVSVEIKTLLRAEHTHISKDAFICATLSRNVEDVLGKTPTFTLCPGFLDMRYFVKAGIQCVCYGPGTLDVAHMRDEYVKLEDIKAFMKVLALTVYDVLALYSPY